MRPRDQVEVASHANYLRPIDESRRCGARREAATIEWQQQQRREVASIAGQIRERDVDNTRREVRAHWRTSIRYHVFATLAETSVGVTIVSLVLAPRVSRRDAIGIIYLARQARQAGPRCPETGAGAP